MDPVQPAFETQRFNPFNLNNNLLVNNLHDPDINLFSENNFQNLDTPYLDIDEAKERLSAFSDENSFKIIHLNIRSLPKNFDNFKRFLSETSHDFSVICLSETWCTNESFNKNSNFLIEGYNSVHFERATNKKGGGVGIYIHNTLMHNVISDLSISDDDNETLAIEIINKESKNVLICVSCV